MLWRVERSDVGSDESQALLREYLVDVSDRWFLLHEGRRSTLEEIEQSLAEMPSDDLAPPTGVFVVARGIGTGPPGVGPTGRLLGCAGVRLAARGSAVELKRMFVRPEARGMGVARALLAAAEQAGRELGATSIRLDTRLDLTEARALYLRHGYGEVPAFNADPYAEVWYAKRLR
ncbi:GNAT family N-acetyltransferase [Intrasporangium mesophilum]